MDEPSIESWQDALMRIAQDSGTRFHRVEVLPETDSTQNAARRMAAAPGTAVVAGRQTQGRGRRGRLWSDEAAQGIAVTFVLPRESDERLAVAAAVGAAWAAEKLVHCLIRLKWPNDLYAANRKFGGVLIEQTDDVALVGIGMNITQTIWPRSLASKAISLRQLGSSASRLDAVTTLLSTFDRALNLAQDDLVQEFTSRDLLRGRVIIAACDGEQVYGRVLEVQPFRGIRLVAGDTERWLPAATTTILSIESNGDSDNLFLPRTGESLE